eukprot:gene16597-biopygen12819
MGLLACFAPRVCAFFQQESRMLALLQRVSPRAGVGDGWVLPTPVGSRAAPPRPGTLSLRRVGGQSPRRPRIN